MGEDEPCRQVRTLLLLGHRDARAGAVLEALVGAWGPAPGGRAAHLDADGGTLLLATEPPLQVLDASTPGTAADPAAALAAADLVALVVSAADGIDAATVALWHRAADQGVPRLVVLTCLDEPAADVSEAVAIVRRVLDDGIAALALPMDDDDGRPAGLLHLLDGLVDEHLPGAGVLTRAADAEHLALTATARDDLVEAVLAVTEDETLLDAHLAGQAPAVPALATELARGVATGWVHPAVPVDTSGRFRPAVGAVLLLSLSSAVTHADPARLPAVTTVGGEPADPLEGTSDGPLVASVLGRGAAGALVRVWCGSLVGGAAVLVDGRPVAGLTVRGLDGSGAAGAGALAWVTGVTGVTGVGTVDDVLATGSTLSSVGQPLLVVGPWPEDTDR